MTYRGLARIHRPQGFEALLGQEHVVRMLTQAIRSDRLAQAFLFCGVRGVGKTTAARILAKAINCEQGPTPQPCGVCVHCVGVREGSALDVIEIDGASHNSVDDVRRLQESLPFQPVHARAKVVIIDEVHMLSTGAFNALLKTLEEPPAHATFVLATTEIHKAPITVRSRCQRYDFRTLPQSTIAEGIKATLAKESIDHDEASVALISREAAGSMRDAMTLLDQVIAGIDGAIAAERVAELLGVAPEQRLYALLRAVLEGRGEEVVTSLSQLAQQGANALHTAQQLSMRARDLAVLKLSKDSARYTDLTPSEAADLNNLAQGHDALELQRLFRSINQTVDDMSRAWNPYLVLEMGLLRLAIRPPLVGVQTLLERLDSWDSSGSAPASPSQQTPPTSQKSIKDTSPVFEDAQAAPQLEVAKVEPTSNTPASETQRATPVSATEPQDPPSLPALKSAPAIDSPPPQLIQKEAATDDPMPRWHRLVDVLRQEHPALAAVLEHAQAKRCDAQCIDLVFPKDSFFAQQAESFEAPRLLAQIAERELGNSPQVNLAQATVSTAPAEASEEESSAPTTLAAYERAQAQAKLEALRVEALAHPAIALVQQVFPESKGPTTIRQDGEASQ